MLVIRKENPEHYQTNAIHVLVRYYVHTQYFRFVNV